MIRVLVPISQATRLRPKLDPRLAALLELSDRAFGAAEEGESRDGDSPAATGALRRSGPLAFLRGPVPARSRVDREPASPPRGGPRQRSRKEPDLDPWRGGFATSDSTVPVFITVADERTFERLRLPIRSRAGKIATAVLATHHIEALEADEDVLSVEWTGGARPTELDAGGRPSVCVRRSMGMDRSWPAALDGSGTYIGIVDSGGVDLYHPDLVDSRNVSRFAWLWDQTAEDRGAGSEGRAPPEWGYGIEVGRRALSLELHPDQLDRYSVVDHRAEKRSHATLVASVAAGQGIENEDAMGIAPGAELIYVGTFGSGERALATMTELAEAVDYTFQRAGRDRRPCVVNLSLGDDLGPHDGTSSVERFFDSLLETEGRAIVIAAGNSAHKRKHATGKLDASAPRADLELEVGRKSRPHVVIEIWFGARTGPSVEILLPGSHGQTPRILATGPAQAFEVGGTHVIVSGSDPYPNSASGLLRVEIFARAGGTLLTGKWRVVLHAEGGRDCEWHAWVDHPLACWSGPAGAAGTTTITSPGTCRRAITVGAYDSSTMRPAAFSGRGPCRGDVSKPDLIACGVDILAASASTPRRYEHAFSGTSAAAPQVAGAVSVLFQRFGAEQTAEQVKQRLLEMADPGGLTAPDPQHGFGRARLTHLETAVTEVHGVAVNGEPLSGEPDVLNTHDMVETTNDKERRHE